MTAPAQVAVPELAEMPSPDTVPGCEHGMVDPDTGPCDAQAKWRMTLAHLASRTSCAPSVVLTCDEHRSSLEKVCRDYAALPDAVCSTCWVRIRFAGDLVRSVVAL